VHPARLDEIDVLFTDSPPPEPYPALLQEAAVECVVAGD
jgi:DeoR family glycerol-3-phosphate regulon repressor